MARFTELQWAAVRATVPSGVDKTWFRIQLEHIAIGTSSPKKQAGICLELCTACHLLFYPPSRRALNFKTPLTPLGFLSVELLPFFLDGVER